MDAVFVLEDSSFNDANQGEPPSYETLTPFRSNTEMRGEKCVFLASYLACLSLHTILEAVINLQSVGLLKWIQRMKDYNNIRPKRGDYT